MGDRVGGSSEFARAMRPVAIEVLGEPNKALSKGDDLRFGRNGSLSVDCLKGTYCDHEAGSTGGGVLEFLRVKRGLEKPDAIVWLRERGLLEPINGNKINGGGSLGRAVAAYDYHDERGNVLFQVVRYDPKTFRPHRPDGRGGYIPGLGGVRLVPFKLPELIKATRDATIFVCEGEKDVLNLQAHGLVATTNAGGAGKWRDEYSAFLAGRNVVALEDNDRAGASHAQGVVKSLRSVAKSVVVLKLPNLPEKGDVSDWLAAGGTAEDLEQLAERALAAAQAVPPSGQAEAAKQASDACGLTVLTPAECEAGDPRPYVIKHLIAEADHGQIIGQPGSGKSALAPLMGYCIALGLPFFGRRVRQGVVLYLACEDGHGLKMRVRALRRRLGDAPGFLLVPDALDFMSTNSDDIERVRVLIRLHRPCAVFIDTVAKAFPGLKENDSDSMGRVVMVVRTIAAEECRPAIVTVHHVAKDAGATPRGHGCLHGDLDVAFLLEGEGAALRSVRMTKNRNGPSDATFSFAIESENFGEDEDGDLTLAPIATPIEGHNASRKSEKEGKLPDRTALVLRDLRELIDRHGEIVDPGEGCPAVRAVTRKVARSRLIERGWFPEHLLRATSDGKSERERGGYAAENHALTGLKRRGFISFNREYAWLI